MTRTRSLPKPDTSGDLAPIGFWQEQARRLGLRWLIVGYAIASLAFWVVAIAASAWLRHFGLGAIVWIGAVVWLYFALPTLYVHAQFILDLCGYALTQRTYFFPILMAMADAAESDDGIDTLPPAAHALFLRLRPYFRAASYTSPIVAIATWALIVLVRLPSEAHTSRSTARVEMRRAIAIGRRIELAISEDYAGRQIGLVA